MEARWSRSSVMSNRDFGGHAVAGLMVELSGQRRVSSRSVSILERRDEVEVSKRPEKCWKNPK
jgi:hypothetical protein